MEPTYYQTAKVFQNYQPKGRVYHSFTEIESGEAILIGGYESQQMNINITEDVFLFNPCNHFWIKLGLQTRISKFSIAPRFDHAAAYLKPNQIIIFGGNQCNPDDQQIRLANNDIALFIYINNQKTYVWQILECSGEKPEKRRAASLTMVGKLGVLCGGTNQERIFNDCWTLDFSIDQEQPIWSQLSLKESEPQGRYYHTSIFLEGNSEDDKSKGLLLFGGFNTQNVWNDYFILRKQETSIVMDEHIMYNPLEARVFHMTQSSGSCIINIGGQVDKTVHSRSIEIFSIKTHKYLRLNLPYSISNAKSIIFDKKIYIFGGFDQRNNEEPINDMIVIDLNHEIESVEEQTDQFLIQNNKNYSCELEIGSSIGLQQLMMINLDAPSKEELENMKTDNNPKLCHNFHLSHILQPREFRQGTPNWLFIPNHISMLINSVTEIIKQEPMIIDVFGPVKIIGDLHGQYSDLMRLFHYMGSPMSNGQNDDIKKYTYLFLGNYVDKGMNSVQILILLMCLKIRYPTRIHLLRGNHEDININANWGFLEECDTRFKENSKENQQSIFNQFNLMFGYLSYAAILEKTIFCCHGGIGPLFRLHYDKISTIKKPINFPTRDKLTLEQKILYEMLWCDPGTQELKGFVINNQRGGEPAKYFGMDMLQDFLQDQGFSMLVRSLSIPIQGYEYFHNNQGVTLFSATNFGGTQLNSGGLLFFEEIQTKFLIIPRFITNQQQNRDLWTTTDQYNKAK